MNSVPKSTELVVNLLDSIDWHDQGYVTGVREYPKSCAHASYALAAADMLEALYK